MNVVWPYEYVMTGLVMFGVVVGEVAFAGGPVDKELALGNPIVDPVELHVHGLGPALFAGVIGNGVGRGVVSCSGGRRLWVAHAVEDLPDGDTLLEIEEERREFCLGCRGENVLGDGGDVQDGTIEDV